MTTKRKREQPWPFGFCWRCRDGVCFVMEGQQAGRIRHVRNKKCRCTEVVLMGHRPEQHLRSKFERAK